MNERKTTTTALKQVVAISAKDLGQRLSLSPRTIWRLVSSGRLPKMVSIGGSKRFLMADVTLFLECNCDITVYQARRESQNGN